MNPHRFMKEQAIEFIESPAFKQFLEVAYGDTVREARKDLLTNADLPEAKRKALVYFLNYVTIVTHGIFESYGVEKPTWLERDYVLDA